MPPDGNTSRPASCAERVVERAPLPLDLLEVRLELLLVVDEQLERRALRQRRQVVRRPHLLDGGEQLAPPDEQADAQRRQPDLRQRLQHDAVVVRQRQIDAALGVAVGEIGLVDDGDDVGMLRESFSTVERGHCVPVGLLGVARNIRFGLCSATAAKSAASSGSKRGPSGTSIGSSAVRQRRRAEDDEAGHRVGDLGARLPRARLGEGRAQKRDQLVRAVAEHQLLDGDAEPRRQRLAQLAARRRRDSD